MTDLLCCPFCGRVPPMSIVLDDDKDETSVVFAYVHCECGTTHSERISEQEAAKAWNTRAQPQYLSNCLRAGACHGKCESAACTNYGKDIVVRRCVEDSG